jgi:hypothetical protein
MVNHELCSRNTLGPLTQQTQPGKCADEYCTSRKAWSLEAWLRNSGQLAVAAKHETYPETLYTAPRHLFTFSGTIESWLGACIKLQPGRWPWPELASPQLLRMLRIGPYRSNPLTTQGCLTKLFYWPKCCREVP